MNFFTYKKWNAACMALGVKHGPSWKYYYILEKCQDVETLDRMLAELHDWRRHRLFMSTREIEQRRSMWPYIYVAFCVRQHVYQKPWDPTMNNPIVKVQRLTTTQLASPISEPTNVSKDAPEQTRATVESLLRNMWPYDPSRDLAYDPLHQIAFLVRVTAAPNAHADNRAKVIDIIDRKVLGQSWHDHMAKK